MVKGGPVDRRGFRGQKDLESVNTAVSPHCKGAEQAPLLVRLTQLTSNPKPEYSVAIPMLKSS